MVLTECRPRDFQSFGTIWTWKLDMACKSTSVSALLIQKPFLINAKGEFSYRNVESMQRHIYFQSQNKGHTECMCGLHKLRGVSPIVWYYFLWYFVHSIKIIFSYKNFWMFFIHLNFLAFHFAVCIWVYKLLTYEIINILKSNYYNSHLFINFPPSKFT
jgi:hypothetical protein